MPKITVIVPIYKVETYIHRCIDSILTQSFRDYDLVLVDDGSPDGCPQICDSYAEKDERVTVIHKPNGGLSDARNAGIDWAMAHSDSEWLAFVDSDDYLHPDYLRILLETAERESADLVICDFIRVNDQEEAIEEEHDFLSFVTEDKKQLFECLRANWRINVAWNKLYGKSVFSDLRFVKGKIHEDDFEIHHVLWNCQRAAVIRDALYYYRQRNNSIMATETPKSRLDDFEALVEQYEFSLAHRLFSGEPPIPIDYLNELGKHRPTFDKPEKQRCKTLKRRLANVVFNRKEHRSLKRYMSFYCTAFYTKLASVK